MIKEAYIISGTRTAIGNFGGKLSKVRTDDLASFVIKKLIEKHPNLNQDQIGDVILGCANQAGEDNRNVARMALLMAGLKQEIPGETINRLCASGMSAIIAGKRAINVNDAEMIIAGGVENMTRGPWIISKTTTPFGRDAQMFDSSFGWRFINPKMKELYGVDAMGETAENLAEKYKIGREIQDIYAYNSQLKAKEAQAKGRFHEEISEIEIPQKKGEAHYFCHDEFIKPHTELSSLAKLKPAFKKDGTVTAGNSSGLNDGASAVLLASEKAIKENNLKPIARIMSSGVIGVEPRIMGIGPVKASEIALQKAGLTLRDIDIIEINEAFSAQVLACLQAMQLENDDPRINPNGGAIALGHPLGMSGSRIVYSAAVELKKSNKKYALCTMCIGVGQGYAVVLEKV
jgi:3-oxoadipyl-CoA thiolase